MSRSTSTGINPLPQHVAIIMDGNGRWAKQRGLSRLEGHEAGTDKVRQVIEVLAGYGIKYLTLYAFSTENWHRPKTEVRGLFRILSRAIDREIPELHRQGIQIRHIGNLEGLSTRLRSHIQKAIELTRKNDGMILGIAFNYGGRDEILEAVRRLVAEGVYPLSVDEALFSNYLYTVGLPDPDLIIRTGGEMRVSNFLLWQGAYSEYYFTNTFWPDFGKEEIEKAFHAYSLRQRRFGRVKRQRKKGSEIPLKQ